MLVDASEVQALLGDPRLVLLDVRWRLDVPDGRPAYREGHLPSGVYVDLERELAGPASAAGGRHPLPDPAALQAAARRWGVRSDSVVVAYDDLGGMSAARAWWLLRDAGVDVRVLDGGLAAWRRAGLPLETGDATPEPGDVLLHPGALPVIDADAAAAFRGTLLDARAGERYRGEVEPVDPRAGHIPGAVSAPTAGNLDADGRFLPPEALRERFHSLGVDLDGPVAAYCGSGITASHELLALAVAGVDGALYPGSWSAWSSDPGRPAATGPLP
ncbi:sulfurtransferase [Amnibacterium kyonggiense]|uniref:Thiosulfate/3-mercaptopyruvate sulfurtransferase n=1 Tax=Amnibacterium kyonggiense TaxID=595671 RepID=A0A4V3EB72_9MICO|nr:sulfurtransferase [Amnibacterium kyonggiense]TDS80454.1 thiosulfate/3-mercaptopyruvate sulfurtransferase [Amnibacterium kyonggiense]